MRKSMKSLHLISMVLTLDWSCDWSNGIFLNHVIRGTLLSRKFPFIFLDMNFAMDRTLKIFRSTLCILLPAMIISFQKLLSNVQLNPIIFAKITVKIHGQIHGTKYLRLGRSWRSRLLTEEKASHRQSLVWMV